MCGSHRIRLLKRTTVEIPMHRNMEHNPSTKYHITSDGLFDFESSIETSTNYRITIDHRGTYALGSKFSNVLFFQFESQF